MASWPNAVQRVPALVVTGLEAFHFPHPETLILSSSRLHKTFSLLPK